MQQYKLFIDGQFTDAQSGRTFEVIDPGTEKPIAQVAEAGEADALAAIEAARRAFESGVWSGLAPRERMMKMQHFADQINHLTLRLVTMECMQSGRVMGFARSAPAVAANLLRNLSSLAATAFPWEEEILVSGSPFARGRDRICREPYGVCVGIVPWNLPIEIASWKFAPALATGNSIILKPASNTPLTALILAEAAKAAGIPDGVFNVLAGPGTQLGNILCTHPDVDKIAFTGSTEVGRHIMKLASDTIKKVTLELGGKSANIILEDADMELAVEGACFGTFMHAGQLCESGTRVLVSSKIYDEFIEKFKKRADALRIGYSLDPLAHLGPLVSRQQLATIESYVRLGRDEGAKLVTGGRRVEVPGINGGYYYAPTIFADVNNRMRIAQEEIFGPVVCVIKFDSDEEAIAIANDSIYGLAGGVFSSSRTRAERISRNIRTGTMWINNYHVMGDYCPFGGYKQSGIGREMGVESLHEYTQIKRIHQAAFADRHTNIYFRFLSDEKKVDGFVYGGPTSVIAGHGCLGSITREIVRLGCKRALIMTDPGVRKAGLADLVVDALGEFCVGVYDQNPPDPDLESVDAAVAAARELRADCIVSVGGGSAIDASKGVCVTLKNGGKVNDHIKIQALTEPQIPHIVIPTTAGTGSEVTQSAVLTSKALGRKLFLNDPFIIPNIAILDPRFTITLPRDMTIASGMDALTHAIEAITSIMANPICEGQALQAIRMIGENLPLVAADGHNEKARLNMQIAATMAGWAFNIAQVGLVHGMAHTVGTLYHIPHGAACGILLPKVMRFNADHATGKLALVAQTLGVHTRGMDLPAAALAAADEIESFLEKIGHPTCLRDVGVPEADLHTCSFHALMDLSNVFNARPVNGPEDILALFKEAY